MVVRFLIIDVVDEFGQVGFADGKKSVAALPGEIGGAAGLFFDPLTGLGFEDVDQLRPGKGRVKTDRQMNVIVHPAHTIGMGFCVVHDRGHHRKQAGAKIAVEPFFAVFGAEHEMDQVAGQGLWHVNFMPGLGWDAKDEFFDDDGNL